MIPPFTLLSLEDAPDRHLTRSKIYAKAMYLQKPLPPKDRPSKRPKRIRIGYFPADFRVHPVAYLIAKVLEKHDRDKFEIFGYSVHGSSSGKMRHRLINSFDYFVDVQGLNDKDVALKARQDDIDIAIMIEREVNGIKVPLPYVIRKTNEKTIADIFDEIDTAQKQLIENAGNYVLGEKKNTFLMKSYSRMPNFLRKAIFKIILRNPFII